MSSASAVEKTLNAYRHILLDGQRVKWGAPQAGRGALVTYATVVTPLRFPEARNCRALLPIDPVLAANGVAAETFAEELRTAFALWSAVADVRFAPAESSESADILIGTQGEPRGRAFTNIELDESASADGIRELKRSTICLNPAERWKVGFNGDLDVYDLRYTLLHEIGHAIGLDHPAVAAQLMDFRYEERFRTLQPGDVAGAVALYGPRRATTAEAQATNAEPRS